MTMSRSEYWVKVIVTSIGLSIGTMVYWFFMLLLPEVAIFGLFLYILITLALSVVQIIWAVHRFHDAGLSGAWLLLNFVPIIGGIAVLIVLCLPTDTFDQW